MVPAECIVEWLILDHLVRTSTIIIRKPVISQDIIVSMTTSGPIVIWQQLLMVTSSLHVLVWEEDGEELLILTSIYISAGDAYPGEWRNGTQSNISFCTVATDGCSSAYFSTNGTSYQRVCGWARGYQRGQTLGFRGSNNNIDRVHVPGLSIIYSSNPHQHIWTFATGNSETINSVFSCPCSHNLSTHPPSSVGNNYYYESGSVSSPYGGLYYFNDILWDGAYWDNEGACYNKSTQPWFFRQLNQTTQDDIEARICIYSEGRETLIDQLELYIQ